MVEHPQMQLWRWLLLPVPFLVCGIVLYGSTFIGQIGVLHLCMSSVLPMGLSIGTAVVISDYLIPTPWHRILIAAYGIGLFLFYSYIFANYLPHPFP
jgi:hypothetical protein